MFPFTGTSDEHITVVESLRSFNPDGAILVTTPQVSFDQFLDKTVLPAFF
jgi:Mrp family chromosome partitioning ATPase